MIEHLRAKGIKLKDPGVGPEPMDLSQILEGGRFRDQAEPGYQEESDSGLVSEGLAEDPEPFGMRAGDMENREGESLEDRYYWELGITPETLNAVKAGKAIKPAYSRKCFHCESESHIVAQCPARRWSNDYNKRY